MKSNNHAFVAENATRYLVKMALWLVLSRHPELESERGVMLDAIAAAVRASQGCRDAIARELDALDEKLAQQALS